MKKVSKDSQEGLENVTKSIDSFIENLEQYLDPNYNPITKPVF